MHVLLDAAQHPGGGQGLLDRGAGVETVEPGEGTAGSGDRPLLVEHRDGRKAGPLGDLEVGGVVGRGDLDRAGAELGVHRLVGDDRDLPPNQREAQKAADHPPVTLVVGMHRHGGVPQHRLGPGGGHFHPALAFNEGVLDVDQLPGDVLVLHLDVAEGGAAARTPVDDPPAPVDDPLLVQADEDGPHRPGEPLVHGEPLPAPVAGVAQAAHLLGDPAPVPPLPLPHPLDEGLPAQVVPGQALSGQLPLDHVLSGDAGVVGARHPESGVALHALTANQGVLNGHVEGVAHVQRPGDVGRRDDDAVGRTARVLLRTEDAGGFPPGVPLPLDPLRIVRRFHRGSHPWCAHDRARKRRKAGAAAPAFFPFHAPGRGPTPWSVWLLP